MSTKRKLVDTHPTLHTAPKRIAPSRLSPAHDDLETPTPNVLEQFGSMMRRTSQNVDDICFTLEQIVRRMEQGTTRENLKETSPSTIPDESPVEEEFR
jgi:hypothetical protein